MITLDVQLTQRRKTPEGYLIVPARFARTGIQHYAAHELGLSGADPQRVIRVYRPPEEVFAAEAIASFDGRPITDEHPDEEVTAENWRAHAVGFARNPRREGEYLVADLTITDEATIEKIEAGKQELSGGYSAEYDWTPGWTPEGEAYEVKQIRIRGNHIATVAAGRAGSQCRVADRDIALPPPFGEHPMTKRRISVDGISLELEETEASAVEHLAAKLKTATEKVDALEEDLHAAQAPVKLDSGQALTKEQLVAKIADLSKQLAGLEAARAADEDPQQRDQAIEAMSRQMGDARRLVPGLVTDGKPCSAIRREVVSRLHPTYPAMIDTLLHGVRVADAAQTAVDLAFNVLASAPVTASAGLAAEAVNEALRRQIVKTSDADLDPRAAYIQQLTHATYGTSAP
ncbi:DUF2213 domain-containing protein [Xylella fastidiosa subsp. multiplex]|uniref:DUF2213 domain-containing protein n=1 Tax=Xylella fastidiosa subsp. multiplex TaxID=644357 RepID=A0A9Q4MF65_XYLFS|nr:DUF2213 domain-containing protein [Xylella fastidiosa]MBE0269836.1 DUF2213 domain-containing protein [Xylella fastidiosa subsp. multiplex]MBE0276484.1 DUF2213 domain-containing protein [Xylella fastidiosa subsp. multiplex]MBE0278562.1 DUF2213 domain-containing protein [Xylella fastidiosa subsp. multiplex]MBE0282957.1 DUF2213 domain-containing protein [Xylella fastidiosa subsp. multiplex]MDD0866532.1 DUF2213 domain-containing protein [Xylella fastidiosa subsp. multiplex]